MKRSWRKPVAIAIYVFSGAVAVASALFVLTRPAVAAMIARHWQEPWAPILVDVFGVLIALVVAWTLDAALNRIVRTFF